MRSGAAAAFAAFAEVTHEIGERVPRRLLPLILLLGGLSRLCTLPLDVAPSQQGQRESQQVDHGDQVEQLPNEARREDEQYACGRAELQGFMDFCNSARCRCYCCGSARYLAAAEMAALLVCETLEVSKFQANSPGGSNIPNTACLYQPSK